MLTAVAKPQNCNFSTAAWTIGVIPCYVHAGCRNIVVNSVTENFLCAYTRIQCTPSPYFNPSSTPRGRFFAQGVISLYIALHNCVGLNQLQKHGGTVGIWMPCHEYRGFFMQRVIILEVANSGMSGSVLSRLAPASFDCLYIKYNPEVKRSQPLDQPANSLL